MSAAWPTGPLDPRYARVRDELLAWRPRHPFRLTLPAGMLRGGQRSSSSITLALGAPIPDGGPLVSCLMVTQNRPHIGRIAVECFRRQTWPNRELVIVDTSAASALTVWVRSLKDPRIRVVLLPGDTRSLGELRNVSAVEARGAYLAQWDDDDLHHPLRLETQLSVIAATDTSANMLLRATLWGPREGRLAFCQVRPLEGSLVCARNAMPRYPSLARMEDTPAIRALEASHPVSYIDLPELYLYVSHGANTWDAWHMEHLWNVSTARFEGLAYESLIDRYGAVMPVAAYREALARSGVPVAGRAG